MAVWLQWALLPDNLGFLRMYPSLGQKCTSSHSHGHVIKLPLLDSLGQNFWSCTNPSQQTLHKCKAKKNPQQFPFLHTKLQNVHQHFSMFCSCPLLFLAYCREMGNSSLPSAHKTFLSAWQPHSVWKCHLCLIQGLLKCWIRVSPHIGYQDNAPPYHATVSKSLDEKGIFSFSFL